MQPVPADFNGFAYVYEGSGRLGPAAGGTDVKMQHAYVLGEGDQASLCPHLLYCL